MNAQIRAATLRIVRKIEQQLYGDRKRVNGQAIIDIEKMITEELAPWQQAADGLYEQALTKHFDQESAGIQWCSTCGSTPCKLDCKYTEALENYRALAQDQPEAEDDAEERRRLA